MVSQEAEKEDNKYNKSCGQNAPEPVLGLSVQGLKLFTSRQISSADKGGTILLLLHNIRTVTEWKSRGDDEDERVFQPSFHIVPGTLRTLSFVQLKFRVRALGHSTINQVYVISSL